jgi:DNA-binding XRE family transcriptional regulator
LSDDELYKLQEEHIERMVDNLPVLRASIRITQHELAKRIGLTR